MKFRYRGSHPATAKAVESGAGDGGALDETVFNSLIADGKVDKTKVRIFYTTKPFVDYVWAARKEIDTAKQEKFVQAFLRLKEGQDDELLNILHGKPFFRATNDAHSALNL